MSQMKNVAVLTCSRCHHQYVLKDLRTSIEDPELKLLHSFMQAISKNGLCPDCKRKARFEAEQALKGAKSDYHVRPQIITIAIDPHYYRKQVEKRNRILGKT